MSAEVDPRFKDNVGECGCGCGAYGTLKKPWRSNGVQCVARRCRCKQCMGRNSKKGGGSKQRKAATALGVPRASSLRPGHEEHWAGTVRIEVKSGAQAGPVWTRYLASEMQSEAARPVGDHRPFVAAFEPKGTSDGLVCFRRSKLVEVVAALAEQLGMTA